MAPDREGSAPGVLITGATSPIGQALVHAFAEAGFFVGIHYHLQETTARQLLEKIRKEDRDGVVLGVICT